MLRQYGTSGTAALLGCTARTLRKKKAKLGIDGEAQESETQSFTLENLPAGAAWTPESLLELLGLDPEGWKITNIKARGGHYGDPTDPNSQVRLEISAVPVTPPFKLPVLDDWKPLPKPKARKGKGPKTSIILSDQHCPHIDPLAHKLICQMIA